MYLSRYLAIFLASLQRTYTYVESSYFFIEPKINLVLDYMRHLIYLLNMNIIKQINNNDCYLTFTID